MPLRLKSELGSLYFFEIASAAGITISEHKNTPCGYIFMPLRLKSELGSLYFFEIASAAGITTARNKKITQKVIF